MALDVEQIATVIGRVGVPEMVKAHPQHRRQRGERGNVPTEVAAIGRVVTVGAHHHGHGIPAHVTAQALFNIKVAGVMGFVFHRNRVDVGGVGREGHVDARLASMIEQVFQQVVCPTSSLGFDDATERIQPFPGFLGIHIHRSGWQRIFRGHMQASNIRHRWCCPV